ncbi:hypothetical protein EZV73_07240 [Acidaminobacter sp. JC074]|uniref:hypothetical protein n=1 Tax=Acidaminobacter sp. JC074 TaxID=2530199 RepID=UPI001F0CE6AD|nr:hypothetical protein [Acidaminobacter sp. JC074]MCH4887359.1 hypothetical protein [Acidaminobacter sp. JC074]
MAKYCTNQYLSNNIMDVSSILTMSLVLIILLVFIVFALELMIPIQLKFEMNGICRGYIYKIESNGKLSEEESDNLKASLEAIGLKSPSIVTDNTGNKFGDKVTLSITCEYTHDRLINLYHRSGETLELSYERTYFIRKIEN